ncbi:MAG: hypothetical protein IPN81_06845 [Nitrosomonadales bacterium]|nr:hypothetical protein [Nitrosomonadales bacterium]
MLGDDLRPQSPGLAVPLLELMRGAGFTKEEFAKLAEAKTNSDTLTRTEFAAMELIESTSPLIETNRTEAIFILHDAAYHQAKAALCGRSTSFKEWRISERLRLSIQLKPAPH